MENIRVTYAVKNKMADATDAFIVFKLEDEVVRCESPAKTSAVSDFECNNVNGWLVRLEIYIFLRMKMHACF